MATQESQIRRLLKIKSFQTWAFISVASRLPTTMGLLLLMLIGNELYGSLSIGAMLAGGQTVFIGLFARWRGQQLDRQELRSGLISHMALTAAMGLVFIGAVVMKAPLWAVFLVAVIQGIASAAIPGGLRSILQGCVPEDQLETANSMDAVITEISFVSGPAIAGLLGMFFGPLEILIFQTAGFVAAAFFMRFLPVYPPVNTENVKGRFVLLYPGARAVYFYFFLFGATFGIFDGVIPKHMQTFNLPEASAGLVMPMISLGSIASGIIASNISGALRVGRPLASALFLILGLSFLGPALAENIILFSILLFFSGLPLAPGIALGNLSLQHMLPNQQRSEGFAMTSSMILLGAGTAQSITGALLKVMETKHIMMCVAILPILAAVMISINLVIRRRAGRPMGMGFPLDPDIIDPAIPLRDRPDYKG